MYWCYWEILSFLCVFHLRAAVNLMLCFIAFCYRFESKTQWYWEFYSMCFTIKTILRIMKWSQTAGICLKVDANYMYIKYNLDWPLTLYLETSCTTSSMHRVLCFDRGISTSMILNTIIYSIRQSCKIEVRDQMLSFMRSDFLCATGW